MIRKCEICNNELFEDENDKIFCPKCKSQEFVSQFDENDDSWMSYKFKIVRPKTKPVTIRMNIYDFEKAKELAKSKNMPYQSLLKEIIHRNLD